MRTSSMHLHLALALSCFVFAGTGCPDKAAKDDPSAEGKSNLSNEEKEKAEDDAGAEETPAQEGPDTADAADAANPMDPQPDEDTGAVPESDEQPCTSNVKKKEEGAKVSYELMCSGTCGGEKKCESRKTTDPHGGTREWCGCADTEPAEGCGMVIATDPKGKVEAICPPKDCGGEPCAIKETGTLLAAGMKLTTLSCSCPG